MTEEVYLDPKRLAREMIEHGLKRAETMSYEAMLRQDGRLQGNRGVTGPWNNIYTAPGKTPIEMAKGKVPKTCYTCNGSLPDDYVFLEGHWFCNSDCYDEYSRREYQGIMESVGPIGNGPDEFELTDQTGESYGGRENDEPIE